MIFDGRWKSELQKLSWAISVWRRLPVFHSFSEHQLNRAILYSATILRKVIEDETEAEEIASTAGLSLPKQETTPAILTATRYPYTAEEGWTVRGIFRAGDYCPGNAVSLKSKDVCNWLIHSCIWSLAQDAAGKCYNGFLVASDFDREKYIHFVSFDEWQRLIKLAIAHGVF